MIYIKLFWEFFKTGLFAIGGGMATVPFLQEMAESTGWFTNLDLANMIAISESTPGPIGVNMATYVGNTCAGPLGGLVATVGLVTPSIIIILIVSAILNNFKESPYVKAAFYGLRPASVALISSAALTIIFIAFFGIDSVYDIGNATLDIKRLVLAAILFVLTRYTPKIKELHPIVFIIFSALVGIVFAF